MNNQDFVQIMINYNMSKSYIQGLKSGFNNKQEKENKRAIIEKNKKYFSIFDNIDVISINKQLLSLCKNTSSCINHALKLVLLQRVNNPLNSFWPILANLAYNIEVYSGYYKQLLNLKEFPTYFRDTIHKDVIRTTSNESMRSKLSNVLNAFTIRNAQIGYCQGFNYITHYLLETQNLSEEETFWFLCHLFETILPPNYYNHLFGVLCDDEIIKKILIKTKPHLIRHIQDLQVETSLFTIQWLVCCFTFHNKLTDTIIDLLLLEGSKALIKATLTYIAILEQHFLEAQDIGSLIMMIENFTSSFQDRQLFLEEYNKIYINNKLLQFLRQDISNQVVSFVQESDNKRVVSLNTFLQDLKKEKCTTKYPICLFMLESWTRNKIHLDSLVLKPESIKIVQDYAQRQSICQRNEILMVRQEHICQKDDGYLIGVLQHKDVQEKTFKSPQQPQSPKITTSNRARSPVKDLLLLPIRALDQSQQIGQRLRMNPKIYKIDTLLLSQSSQTISVNVRPYRGYQTQRGRSPQYKKMMMKKMNLYGSPKRQIDQNQSQNILNQSTDVSQPHLTLLRESKSITFLLQLTRNTNLISIEFQQDQQFH